MPVTQKVAKGKTHQQAWAGDVDALRSLVKQAERLADYVREKRVAALTNSLASRRAKWDADHNYLPLDEREERWVKSRGVV